MASSHVFNTPGSIMESATVTAVTSAATGYPKENILDYNPSTYWKPTSTADQTINFDLGSAQVVEGIAIFVHNYTTDHGNSGNSTILVEWSDNGTSGWTALSTEVLASYLTTSSPIAVINFSNLPKTKRYWRVTFGTMVTTIEISGIYFCSSRSITIGNKLPEPVIEWYETRTFEAEGGRQFAQGVNRNESFEWPLSFSISGTTNLTALLNAYRDCRGELFPMVWSPNSGLSALVRFVGKMSYQQVQHQYYEVTITLRQIPYIYPGKAY